MSLEIEFRQLIIKYLQARNQEFFRAGEVFQNKGTSINFLSTTQERKTQQGKISDIFFLDALKTAFQIRNLTHRRTQLEHFFPKSGHFSLNFKKGQGRPPPFPLQLRAWFSNIVFTINSFNDISSVRDSWFCYMSKFDLFSDDCMFKFIVF